MEDIKRVFEKVIENLETGILFVDTKGLIRIINPVMSDLIQYKKGEALNRFFRDLASPSNPLAGAVFQVLEEFYTEGLPVSKESPDIKIEEVNQYYDLCARVIYCENGIIQGLLLMLNAAAARYIMANNHTIGEQCAQISQLAAGAAHEIRNPLTTVRGFIQLLQKDFVNTSKEEYLDLVLGEIDRITKILHEFMQLVKPASSSPEPVHLGEIADEVVILTEFEAKAKGVKVCSRVRGQPVANIDRQQFKQVLLNLFKNAFEAMPLGGKLQLRITPRGRKINIAVIDNGTGIDKSLLKNLERPYFTTKETGTGLGLTISRQIINNHEGDLRIRTQPGVGTIVLIRLPCIQSQQEVT